MPCDDPDGWDGGLVGGRLNNEGIYVYMIADFRSCTSLVAQMVKNLPAMQETQVRSLCWEDPLE